MGGLCGGFVFEALGEYTTGDVTDGLSCRCDAGRLESFLGDGGGFAVAVFLSCFNGKGLEVVVVVVARLGDDAATPPKELSRIRCWCCKC